MFERFTDRARRVVVLAQDAAREMGHRQIKPHHLLVALSQGEGMAANAMAEAGVDRAALRERVAASTKADPAARKANKLPFSAEGKKALELSLRAALSFGHNYIGTEHLFLGVQREAEGRGEALDDLLGVSGAEIETRLREMLRGAPGAAPMRTPGLVAVMNRARQAAGQSPMTTGHVLAGVMAEPDTQAARALSSLGLTGESVTGALATVPIAETSDATPPLASISVTIGGTTTVISDAELATIIRDMPADELREALKKAIS